MASIGFGRVCGYIAAGIALLSVGTGCASPPASGAAAQTVQVPPPPPQPEIRVQTGPVWPINGIALTPDGKKVVTASESAAMAMWDADSGLELRKLSGHVTADVAIDASGTLAFSAGKYDNSVRLWDLGSGAELAVLPGHTLWVSAAAISPDGSLGVSGSAEGEVLLWDLKRKILQKRLRNAGSGVLDLAFAPDGKSVAVAAVDGSLTVIPTSASGPAWTTKAHTGKTTCLAFAASGALIVSGGSDGAVRVWDAVSGEVRTALGVWAGQVNAVAVPDDTFEIIVASAKGPVEIWDGTSGTRLRSLANLDRYDQLAVSADGGTLAASRDDLLRIVSLNDTAPDRTVAPTDGIVSLADSASPGAISLATSAIAGDWLVDEARFEPVFDDEENHIARVSVAKGSTLLVTAGQRQLYTELRLWDARSGALLDVFTGMPEWKDGALVCAISPDGKRVAAAWETGPVYLWERGTRNPAYVFKGHDKKAPGLVFSPDGRYLGSCGRDGKLFIWEAASGRILRQVLYDQALTVMAFSPDGTKTAIARANGNLAVAALDGSGEVMIAGDSQGAPSALLFSPDGRWIYAGAGIGQLRKFDAATGQVAVRFLGTEGGVSRLVLTPDGRRLASCGADNAIRVWDSASGALLYSAVVDGSGEYLAWTPEGYFGGSRDMAERLVYVLLGETVLPIDQYREVLYRPDLVAAKSRTGRLPEGTTTLAAICERDSLPPSVAIIDSAPGVLDSRDIAVKLRITDRGGGIGRVMVYLDGMPVAVADGGRGLSVVGKGSAAESALDLEIPLTLRAGENLIEASAYNAAGSVESARSFRRYQVRAGEAAKPRLNALLVAIDKYRDGALRLAYSVADADALADALAAAPDSLYAEVSARRLFDAEATAGGIAAAFDELAASVRPEDLFVLYFAGHGVANERDGEYYFLPVDFRYRDANSLPEQGISKQAILDNLLKIKAEKTIIFFDTCNSGAFLAGPGSRGLAEKTALDRLKRAVGRTMIVASSDTQVALEGYNGHGVFTWVLIEGMGGKADADRNGYVSVKELSTWVEGRVPDLTYQTWGYEQIPQSLLPKQDFPFLTVR